MSICIDRSTGGAVFVRAEKAKRRNQHNCNKPHWQLMWRPWKIYSARTPWFSLSLSLGYGLCHWEAVQYYGFWGVALSWRPNSDRHESEPLFFSRWSIGVRREV